jgi:ribosome-binding factor A
MTRSHTTRRYPRRARVNEVVRETIADEVERLNDPRLGLVTITGVDVSPDLRQATVYYSALETAPGGRGRQQRIRQPRSRKDQRAGDGRQDQRGDDGAREVDSARAAERLAETRAALQSAAPHLRAELGRQVRMKYTPELTFREDPAVTQGSRIEEIIRELHRDDDPALDPALDHEADA